MMTVRDDAEVASLLDDGVVPERRRRITLLAVWLLVAFDAVVTALTIGAWLYLRAGDTEGMWRGLACSRAHPCASSDGYFLTGPVPAAGVLHLAGVVVGALVVGALAWQAERAGSRWALGSVAAALVTLGLLAAAYSGLMFHRFDGAYATAYFYVLLSCALHLTVVTVVLTGLANRARLGRADGDVTPFHAVRVLVVGAAAAVVSLCVVASVAA